MQKKKVVVAGNICLDITPIFPPQKGNKIEYIMQPGKLIHMAGVDVHTGGAVANTGLGMKILGADVKLMAKLGNDEFGKLVMEVLHQYGDDKDFNMAISEVGNTSYSVVVAIPGIDRIFLHSPGVNDTLSYEDIDMDVVAEAALFHFGYPPLMRNMYIQDGEEMVKILRKVKSFQTATSLDMAFIDSESEAGKTDWKKWLEKVLPYVDFFVPSAEEICNILDKERYKEWCLRADGRDITEILDIEKDIKPLADELLTKGAKVILIKCGASGMYYRTAEEAVLKKVGADVELDVVTWANKEGFESSFVPEQILSGTGAGDTSIAAFLTAMLEGRPIEKCVELAAATGASCVEAYDALSGLKSFEKLEKKIQAGWQKNRRSFE